MRLSEEENCELSKELPFAVIYSELFSSSPELSVEQFQYSQPSHSTQFVPYGPSKKDCDDSNDSGSEETVYLGRYSSSRQFLVINSQADLYKLVPPRRSDLNSRQAGSDDASSETTESSEETFQEHNADSKQEDGSKVRGDRNSEESYIKEIQNRDIEVDMDPRLMETLTETLQRMGQQ